MSAAPQTTSGRPRVLVVDDERWVRDALVRAFAAEHDIDIATNGEEGVAQACAHVPNLVLTDMTMPRMSGDDLVRELRGRRELDNVPIMLLTAIADDDLRVRVLADGAQDYVLKPFNIAEVMARAKNLIAMKRTREILQHEVAGQQRDLEALAQEVLRRQRQVEGALEEMTLARDQAAEASAVKSTFLDLISHELRTPLTIIQLGLQTTLSRPAPPDDPDRRTLERVMAAANRLGDLVESLLARTDAESSLQLDITTFDPTEVVHAVEQEYAQAAANKGLALATTIQPGVTAITSDARIVRRVLRGLVDNAVKFTAAGRVDIVAEPATDPAGVRLLVKDTGRGISTADRERVFNAFETVEPIQHKHTPGLGLGLAIVRASARMISGAVSLTSGTGEGTTVTVTLPTLAPAAPAAPAA